jgi:hypothetical protein
MNGKHIQFNQRSLISLLLAVLMLALAATPALAWLDEGKINEQAALPCRVISDGGGEHTVYCAKMTRQHYSRVAAEQPLLRPSIAKAELMSMPDQQLAQTPTQ